MNNQPIGVLDSGVGGLTVWQEIIKQLPEESTVYIGDSLHAPYGTKTKAAMFSLAKKLIRFLLNRNVKLIVIACNTLTVNCISELRATFPTVPLIGVTPVIKVGARITQNNTIGLLATTSTINSSYCSSLIERFAPSCRVICVGTDSLVPLIEKYDKPTLHTVLKKELAPFINANIDTLILGCTHFPLIKGEIQAIMGKQVNILDSGGAVARHVRSVLEKNKIIGENKTIFYRSFTTGSTKRVTMIINKLLVNEFDSKMCTVEKIII